MIRRRNSGERAEDIRSGGLVRQLYERHHLESNRRSECSFTTEFTGRQGAIGEVVWMYCRSVQQMWSLPDVSVSPNACAKHNDEHRFVRPLFGPLPGSVANSSMCGSRHRIPYLKHIVRWLDYINGGSLRSSH